MARNDFSVMKTRVTETLHDNSLTTKAGDWINETIQDIHHRSKLIYLHVESTLATVASQQDYNFSDIAAASSNDDVMRILYIRDRSNDCSLQEVSYASLYDSVADPEDELSNSPTHYAIKDQSIVIFPIPSQVLSLDVDYQKRSTDLSGDTDTPDLPLDWTDIILLGAEARGLRYLKRSEWAQTQQFYEGEVRRRISGERRPNMRFRLRQSGVSFRPIGPRIKV